MKKSAVTAIYVLSPQGIALALRLGVALDGVCFAPHRLAEDAGEGVCGFDSLPALVQQQFGKFRQHIFIAATGIVVRCIAPLLAGKTVDPAVLVLDNHGKFVISLVSGHLGGANDLARQVAEITGGAAVITTATDTEGLPAPDVLAVRAGLHVLNSDAIRMVSAALLAGKTIPLHDPEGWLLPWLRGEELGYFRILDEVAPLAPRTSTVPQAPQVQVAWRGAAPSATCLVLVPPALCLGVGCRKGVSAEEILDLIHKVCTENNFEASAVACLASVDIKAEEPGLVQAAAILGVPLRTFSAGELAVYPPAQVSAKATAALGLPGVCEPAARCAAGGGPLLVGKQTLGRVTLAVAGCKPDISMG